MVVMTETIGRSAVIALSRNYQTFSEAMMELVDNPFDHRRGQHLHVDVTVDKRNGLLRVLDYGGEGMDDADLGAWIRWGEGPVHSDSDIGQWHVGGKTSAIYLANSIEIICRKRHQGQVWYFEDPEWGTRTGLYQGEPRRISFDQACQRNGDLWQVPEDTPFACVTLRQLRARRYDTVRLKTELGDVYRTLLKQGECTIRINGEPVRPLEIPVAKTIPSVTIKRRKLARGVVGMSI